MYSGRSESSSGKGLYRSRDGLFFGVCKGLAEYLNFPVFWMRVLWVAVPLLTLVSFPFVLIAYFVAAIVMKPEPVVPFASDSDREFYDSYVSSRAMAINRLKRTYENLDRRIQRIESIVTSTDFDWDRRLSETKN
jgi:phage shock protein C